MKKQVIVLILYIIVILGSCGLIEFKTCRNSTFIAPVKIYPMKDTFHVGDTLHVHIEFSEEYKYNGKSYTIINNHIDFTQFVGFIQDTSFFTMFALAHSKVTTDTSKFNVFKYKFNVDGSYSIIGDIEKIDDKYIVDYAFTLNDTGFINSFFLFPLAYPPIDLKNGCHPKEEMFRLDIPPGEDDNYDIFSREDNGVYTEPGHEYIEDYKNRASYTFYVVE